MDGGRICGSCPRPIRPRCYALLARANAASDHPPLPEPQQLAVSHLAEAPDGERIVVARRGRRAGRGGPPLPCPRRLDGRARGGRTRRCHARGGAPAGAAAAGRPGSARRSPRSTSGSCRPPRPTTTRAAGEGFVPERDLLQMRVRLPLPADVVAATRPLVTRAFVVGRDEEAWVETNNRAFAGHPEQGAWTVAELRERMAADWVDLDDFLVADDPDGPGLIGACWTKVHRDRTSRPRRDLRDRRRPPPPRAGLGPLPHRGRAHAPGRPRASRSACSTPTPPTWPPSRSTARSASRSTTSTAPTGATRPAERHGPPSPRRPAQLMPVPMALPDPEGHPGRHDRHRQLPQRGHHDGPFGEAGQHDADRPPRPRRPARWRARWPSCPR